MRALSVGLLVLLVSAAPAAAQNIPITITGTDGRDAVLLEIERSFESTGETSKPRGAYFITGASTVVSNAGVCETVNDPLTARRIGHRCTGHTGSPFAFSVDLRGGNDDLAFESDNGPAVSVSVLGGVGDDVLKVDSAATVSISGGDGNDTLSAPPASNHAATLDGGLGRDLADFPGGQMGTSGLTANLSRGSASQSATVFVLEQTQSGLQPVEHTLYSRGYTLRAVERVQGTERGDLLTGGTGADELIGLGGPDVLDGADGADILSGGTGLDRLLGGAGADQLDGGTEIDEFVDSSGGTVFISRDGFAESLTCASGDTVVNDLADRLSNPTTCASVQTAAAKHLLDTTLPRTARVAGGRLVVRLSCPEEKPERCAGRLEGRRYSIAPGRRARLRLPVPRGRTVRLTATEVDKDGRPRRVVRRVRVRR